MIRYTGVVPISPQHAADPEEKITQGTVLWILGCKPEFDPQHDELVLDGKVVNAYIELRDYKGQQLSVKPSDLIDMFERQGEWQQIAMPVDEFSEVYIESPVERGQLLIVPAVHITGTKLWIVVAAGSGANQKVYHSTERPNPFIVHPPTTTGDMVVTGQC
jgi:hypothetical protein